MRTIIEQIKWLADHPELTQHALRIDGDSHDGITVQVRSGLDEWTRHRHFISGYCHRYLEDDGVKLVSATPVEQCDDLCPCGEPIPHAGDPACSAEHNNSSEYDEAIEAN